MKNMATAATLDNILPFLAEGDEPTTTHEEFIHAVRDVVTPRVVDGAARQRLQAAKLVYGGGHQEIRGLTYFGAWSQHHDFLEIAAVTEESFVQLAGTTIHELAHCLAGPAAGHGTDWKAACALLGLEHAQAGGQAYCPDHFAPSVWSAIEALPHPSDGKPTFRGRGGAATPKARPCPLGIGTRGGRSRGTGSGSRLRLWVCGCPEGTPGRKVRVASDEWDATCNRCRTAYARPA
jgi:hypothetical protein